MFVVKHRKIFYILSGVLLVVSVGALFIWGLNLGIDFKGGSILEVNYPAGRPETAALKSVLDPLALGDYSVRPTNDNGYIIRMRTLSEAERQTVVKTVALKDQKIEEKRFDSIGPLLGKEAIAKSLWAIAMVMVCIVLFIAFAFRKVSEPVSSWKYGVIAVVALIHDVVIPTGVFSIVGHLKGFEIDTLFVTAILVVLGFSVHDTIVVFDRVRENLKLEYGRKMADFETIVGKSINQTFVRSINTSLTTLLALVALYFIGPVSTQLFSVVLIVGIITGTYSSIFIASPLLVTVERWQHNKQGV
jgi:preprotein translocase subunit SecF